jgi:hypothetical protein
MHRQEEKCLFGFGGQTQENIINERPRHGWEDVKTDLKSSKMGHFRLDSSGLG